MDEARESVATCHGNLVSTCRGGSEMNGPPTETWGHCAACKRWFYCGHGPPDVQGPAPDCPVCLRPALDFELRQEVQQ